MAIYPCGDSTGVYYLVVSGLPWSATWQKLKDFVRYPESGGSINVEHVFIYPSATDGWVKVRGKEDFRRAYGESVCFMWRHKADLIAEYLNGRVFQGKAIVADDRNVYTMVNLRDMAPIQTSNSVTRRKRSTSSSPETYYALPAGYPARLLSSPQYSQHDSADSYTMYRSSAQSSEQDVRRPRSPNSQR
jgi:hypothetical protein